MAARGLGETLLAPLVTVPAELQADLAQVVTRHGLSKREVTSIAAAAREYGRDGVQRIIEGWQQPTGARARRSAVSWEALLTAVPQDVDRRCAALRAELSALPPKRRQARLEQIAAQRRLLAALGDHFDAILAEYGEAIRTNDTDEQEMPPASS